MFFISDKFKSVGCSLPYKCKKEREHGSMSGKGT
jgi:hypothetical protein